MLDVFFASHRLFFLVLFSLVFLFFAGVRKITSSLERIREEKRKRRRNKPLLYRSTPTVRVFEHAFQFRLTNVSWRARYKRAMKRKYRDNSIDTSPASTSSESPTLVVS